MERGYGFVKISKQLAKDNDVKEMLKDISVTAVHEDGENMRYYGFSDKFDCCNTQDPQQYQAIATRDGDEISISFEAVKE